MPKDTKLPPQDIDPDGTSEIELEGTVFRRIHNSTATPPVSPPASDDSATPIQNIDSNLFANVTQHIGVLFCAQDFGAMRFDTIAHDLQLSPQQHSEIVRYFGSAINACHVYIDGIFREIFSDLTHSLILADPPTLKLRALARTHARRIMENTAFFQTIHDVLVRDATRAQTPASLIERIEANHHKSRRLIATLIAEGQMSGELRQGDPALFTHSIFAAMYGIISHTNYGHQTVGTGIYSEDAVLETLMGQLRGLRPDPIS